MPNKPREGLTPISMRIEPDLLARLEYRAAVLRAEHPGIQYGRLDVIREALAKLPEPPPGWAPGQPPPAKRSKAPAVRKRG